MDSYALDINNAALPLTRNVIDCLNNSLSKLSIAILKELYEHPQMQQKSLAASIHTSATSLSNILSRLEGIQPQLLISERVGRSKYYSLTEIAHLYVEQVIQPQSNKIHAFAPLSQEELIVSETFNILYQFQKSAGDDWDLILDNMLAGNAKAEMEYNELSALYLNFMEHIKQLETMNQPASIREVYNILKHPILIKRVQTYLAKELSGFYALKPFMELEKQDYGYLIQIIDKIFTRIAPEIFPIWNTTDFYNNTMFSEDQYNKFFHELFIMKNDFYDAKYNSDKQLILKYWRAKYFTQGFSLEYIAEKCFTLYNYKRRMKQSLVYP